MREVRRRLPNSLVLVMDPDLGQVPDVQGGALVAATPTCLAVGTLSAADGETTISLDDEPAGGSAEGSSSLGGDLRLAWQGSLAVETQLAVVTVTGEVLASSPARGQARVEVWVNDAWEPDVIRVVVRS